METAAAARAARAAVAAALAAAGAPAAGIRAANNNQLFKLDVTTLDAGEHEMYMLMLNFNIPRSVVEEDQPFTLEEALGDVVLFLDREFSPEPIYYQVTASYYLRHRQSGDERLFTGSFCPKAAHATSLSGPVFRLFEGDTFSRDVRRYTTPQNILDCLDWPEDDESDWSFLSLTSVILNCQVKLSWHNQYIRRKNLLSARGNRHGRRHVTFSHPW